MYLRRNRRLKDGKEHCYWNIVESKRCAGGKVVQRQVLYLGEINDSHREAWCEVIEAFDEGSQRPRNWRCSPLNERCRSTPRVVACRYGSTGCSCIVRGNGERVGWPAHFMSSLDWMSSGRAGCRRRVKALLGITSCRRWCATG